MQPHDSRLSPDEVRPSRSRRLLDDPSSAATNELRQAAPAKYAAQQLEQRFVSRAVRSPWLILSAVFALGLFAAGAYFLFAAHGQASKLAAGGLRCAGWAGAGLEGHRRHSGEVGRQA
jgi:hypothetical protein